MAKVHDLAGPALAAQQVAAKAGLDTKDLRSAYQVADEPYEYQQVAAQLGAFLGEARAYESVKSEVHAAGLLTRLGEKVVPADQQVADAKASIEDLQFTSSQTALAAARSKLGTAKLVGTAIVGGALLVVLLVVLMTATASRRRSRRPRVVAQQAWTPLGALTAPGVLTAQGPAGEDERSRLPADPSPT
jgi:hypothetical protein